MIKRAIIGIDHFVSRHASISTQVRSRKLFFRTHIILNDYVFTKSWIDGQTLTRDPFWTQCDPSSMIAPHTILIIPANLGKL